MAPRESITYNHYTGASLIRRGDAPSSHQVLLVEGPQETRSCRPRSRRQRFRVPRRQRPPSYRRRDDGIQQPFDVARRRLRSPKTCSMKTFTFGTRAARGLCAGQTQSRMWQCSMHGVRVRGNRASSRAHNTSVDSHCGHVFLHHIVDVTPYEQHPYSRNAPGRDARRIELGATEGH